MLAQTVGYAAGHDAEPPPKESVAY
jgi:hypothetical protein